ncbi:MAG: hypothetical protein M1840_006936 [Geoglossum simile]|nr:MAG: hypothetical protein M1840_006936 [Geoglossum simile]
MAPGRPSLRTSRSAPAPFSHSPNLSEYDFPARWSRASSDTSRAPSSHGSKSITDYRGEAKSLLGGTINGLRCGNYPRVTVLFVTWEDDDMNCIRELGPLKRVFEDEFLFRTQFYRIPSEQSMKALNKELSKVDNPPGGLTIFYYGGHGYIGEETGKLKFAAKGDRYTEGNLFYQDIINALKLLDGDLLLILDTCFAGGAIYHHKLRRAIELLAATAHDRMTPGPERMGSFTPVLADKLRLLLKEKPRGFLVSELFYSLDIDDRLKIKPRWYPQSEMDCGRIFLCPQVQPPAVQTEATLHLCLSIAEPPDTRVLLDIGNSLRFTPHVKKITIGDLNAPDETIKDLRRMATVAHMFRWWARRARERFEANESHSWRHETSQSLHGAAQAASPRQNPAGKTISVRIPELFTSPRRMVRPKNKPLPRILLDGRDPPTSSNPYSLLADASRHHANPHLLHTDEATPTSSAEGDTSLTEEISRPVDRPGRRGRRRGRRKMKRTEQPPIARIPLCNTSASITGATLIILFIFITFA